MTAFEWLSPIQETLLLDFFENLSDILIVFVLLLAKHFKSKLLKLILSQEIFSPENHSVSNKFLIMKHFL